MSDNILRDYFAELQKANQEINYTEYKRKDKFGKEHISQYAEVKEKVKAFRKLYPCGGIVTKILVSDEDRCVVRCEVFDESGSILGTGSAAETKDSVLINKNAILEICETSAVGRALAFLGIGIKDGIASAEDMRRVEKGDEIKNNMLLCHRCNHQIIDTEDKSGKIWKADEISEITTKYYGDPLCFRCLREIKKQKTDIEV